VVGEGFHIGAGPDSQSRAGTTLIEEMRRQSYRMAWEDLWSWLNALHLVLRCGCSLCSALFTSAGTDDLPEIYPATVLPEMLIQHVQCQMRTRVDQDAEVDH